MEGITFYTEEFRIEKSEAKVSNRNFELLFLVRIPDQRGHSLRINSMCSPVVLINFFCRIKYENNILFNLREQLNKRHLLVDVRPRPISVFKANKTDK